MGVTVQDFLYMIDGVGGIDIDNYNELKDHLKKFSIFPKHTRLVSESDWLLLEKALTEKESE